MQLANYTFFNSQNLLYIKPVKGLHSYGLCYRFAFNGQEKDDEVNFQDYGFRIYNNRLGRFLSVDPLTAKYPFYTPYQFAGNMPIKFIDLDGLEPAEPGKEKDDYSEAPVKDKSDKKHGWTWDGSQWNDKGTALNDVVVDASKTTGQEQSTESPSQQSWLNLGVLDDKVRSFGQHWDMLGAIDDKIRSAGPDAGGSTAGFDVNFIRSQFGRSVSRIETEDGYTDYTTGKIGGQKFSGISVKLGGSFDFYWKTDAGKNKKVSELILGESTFFSAGGGIMVTLSLSKDSLDQTTLYGLSVTLGAGYSGGKQVTEKLDINLIR